MHIRNFQFRPVLTACALLGLAVLVSLGSWQLQRLQWKRDLLAAIDARIHAAPVAIDAVLANTSADGNGEYEPVFAEGVMRDGETVRVFGTYDGAAGYWYFTPMTLDDGKSLYVNRGFVPQSLPNTEIDAAPETRQRVVGLLRLPERPRPPESWFRPLAPTADGLWYVRDPQAMAAAAGVTNVVPYYVDEIGGAENRYPRSGLTRTDFRNKHFEYAMTWFGLAAALIGVWIAFSLQPKR